MDRPKWTFSAQRIRDVILYHFNEHMGVNLSISMYRHVAIAFVEKYLKGYMVDIAFHLQAG